jgi:hypothetical protein
MGFGIKGITHLEQFQITAVVVREFGCRERIPLVSSRFLPFRLKNVQ